MLTDEEKTSNCLQGAVSGGLLQRLYAPRLVISPCRIVDLTSTTRDTAI